MRAIKFMSATAMIAATLAIAVPVLDAAGATDMLPGAAPVTATPSPSTPELPEPAMLLLFGAGLAATARVLRRAR